jgi:acyl carrier protein
VRHYLTENFTLGSESDLSDSGSLVESGILDSTGVIELIAFLEHTFEIAVPEEGMTAENLDSVDRICSLVARLSF